MDFCRNLSVPGGLPSEYPPETITSQESCKLDELFPGQSKECDVDLEWLSIFLEDCFSTTGCHLPQSIPLPKTQPAHVQSPNPNPLKAQETLKNTSLQNLAVPAKARTKRRRTVPLSGRQGHVPGQLLHVIPSDPPLLQQAYWMAESELLIPKKVEKMDGEDENKSKVGSSGSLEGGIGQPRRCSHCLAQRTPQWRAGPLGPKTLCNACGVRFKSGRLLPEYRPAKSPTFVSYKHSNSHKKVMEMRMAM